MKQIHIPNQKLYEQYYLDQAKQRGGSLPAFHGARFQRGYGLGAIFKGLFRWAVPHLKQGAKVLGKKALQAGMNVAQDVAEGENVGKAVRKRTIQAVGELLPQKPSEEQAGAVRKGTNRPVRTNSVSSPSTKKRKTAPQKKQQGTYPLFSS